jgi:alkanesulfonate monooxygenase SsuD/methylene tetrahydromethanopterin reductase-like flavin-dependent oxidoreductase (luciferase family)
MKSWYFTEAAFPDIPEEEDYESVRVSLPNRHYEPKAGADYFHRFLDEWRIADEEGLNIMVNEHHQTPTCVDVAAPVMLGIIARETKKARLLILGNPIANRSQPIRVAEEMAMVDVLSRGRLECGFVKSVPYEVASGNSNPMRMNERMWEAHDLIVKAWTSHDGPFSFEGRFFHHRMVNIWPRPYQAPHPPIWVASMSPNGAAKVGEHGYVITTFLTGFKATPAVFASYRDGWRKAGRPGNPGLDRLSYCALVYTADTDAEARKGGEELLWYMNHTKVPLHFKNPPGYNHFTASAQALRTGRLGFRNPGDKANLDEEIAKGTVFCGTPDTVYKQIKTLYDHVGGFGHLLAMGQAGFMDHETTVKGIRLFAREVQPRLDELKLSDVAA